MDLVDVVSTVAIFVTVGLNCAGLFTCRKIASDGGVGSIPHLPFVAACLMASLWFFYGYLRQDSSIILVNVIGLLMQLSYIVIYTRYADNKVYVVRDFSIAFSLVIGVAVYFVLISINDSWHQSLLGIICNIFTVLFFSSPLVTMSTVIKTRSTSSMSLSLSVMSALTSGSWLLYGLLIGDLVIIFPNGVGLMLSLLQLYMFVLYPSTDHTSSQLPL